MLDRDAGLHVVRPREVRIGATQRRQASEANRQLAEIDLAAGRLVRASEIALRDVVSIEIDPRQVRRRARGQRVVVIRQTRSCWRRCNG